MRVTGRSSSRNYLKYLNKALTDQAAIQERMASKNRFEKVSDDVSSGIQAMKARTELFKAEKNLDNVQSINDMMTSAESALISSEERLSDIYPKILKAVNGTTNESDRKVLAQEIEAMRMEILTNLNTQISGQYLFGGTNNYSAPFTFDDKTGKLKYNGVLVDEIQKREDGTYFYESQDAGGNKIEVEIPMDKDVYMDVGLGIRMSGPSVDASTAFKISFSGLDIAGWGVDGEGMSDNFLNILGEIHDELVSDNYSSKNVDKLATKLKALSDKFLTNVTDMGSRTQFLSSMEDRLEKNVNTLDNKISRLTATEYDEESIHQATNTAVLNALYRLGSSVIPLSLMDFLS